MKAVIQRVTEAAVRVSGDVVGRIGVGQLILLGVAADDTDADVSYLARKAVSLRIFEDEDGKMNRSIADVGGSILVVSQFTLYADVSRGARPSYELAAKADVAHRLYDAFVGYLRESGVPVETGVFQADMEVSLVNDGPVTIICESPRVPTVCT